MGSLIFVGVVRKQLLVSPIDKVSEENELNVISFFCGTQDEEASCTHVLSLFKCDCFGRDF